LINIYKILKNKLNELLKKVVHFFNTETSYIRNCNQCKFISITEEKQTNKNINHVCLKHRMKVFHRSCYPNIEHLYIYPCESCNGKDFQIRIEGE